MRKVQNLLYQSSGIILISLLVSLIFNQARSKPLHFFKKTVEVVTELERLNLDSIEPSITGIDIILAKKLFEENMIFIDARAEEYYNEGHIPGAICNDNFDSLLKELENVIKMDDSFVVYCSDDDCGSSEDLSFELQSYGFNNILLFKGGWKEWVDADMPKENYE
tara:strand:+ start:1571 stop:2065 length:495 start_codon:yes stop_codon:yes gene_type:complete